MPIQHKQNFGIYYWDTFERPGEDTFLIAEADTLVEAETFVEEQYKSRIKKNGADRVEIVDLEGNIVKKYKVG